MEGMEMIAFQIIAAVGTARSLYIEAIDLAAEGKYEEAYAMFEELGNYKDSQKFLSRFVYFPTVLTYTLFDRTGVMTVDFGAYNLPSRMLSDGSIGTKDGMYIYDNQHIQILHVSFLKLF